MIGKELPLPTRTEELNTLLQRTQTLPGMWPSGRIEMVGTRFGRVAAGVFPNIAGKVLYIVVADTEKGELTTQVTFVSAENPLENPNICTLGALIGENLYESGGLEERPVLTEERRKDLVGIGKVLGRVSVAGCAYDPFQNTKLVSHLIAAADSVPAIHPAVLDAVSSIRS